MKTLAAVLGYFALVNLLALGAALSTLYMWRRGWCLWCGPKWLAVAGAALIVVLINRAAINDWHRNP